MSKIWQIVLRKPVLFILLSLVYLLVVGLLKWRFKPTLGALWYLGGGFVGVYFLDFAEAFFQLAPSPFRSVIFAAPFAIVSFFVVTSSGSLLASGLVLSLYLQLILWQIGEWRIVGNLTSWYRLVAVSVDQRTQRLWLIIFVAIFLVESYLFIR